MNNPDFTIKEGDTSPAIEVELRDGDSPIELSTANVGFRMRHRMEEVTVAGTCTIDSNNPGTVSYIWDDGDTDTTGDYDAEFIVDYDDPNTIDAFDVDETFPSDDFLHIRVTETLDTVLS